jgi:tRNA pseudouridine32 synthase/23S rRNA pseudouridine746 synthase
MVAGEPFFRMQEVAGESNSETCIALAEDLGSHWRYALQPVSGRKHQLRLHMASLGAPICNDPFYPVALPSGPDDYARPLQLLAQRLQFRDPLDGRLQCFESRLQLKGGD